jgi:fructokinase
VNRTRAHFVVLGEALVDIVISAAAPPRTRPGGSPLNVAVGLARLGHDVLLVTRIGDDPHGDLVRAHLAASGVRLAEGSVRPGAATGSATALVGADGAASYQFALDPELPHLPLPAQLDALHVGSLGSVLQPGASAVAAAVQAARARGVLVCYDPNARPGLVEDRPGYVAAVHRLAAAADVVKASAEDIAFICGTARPDWHPLLSAVTDGNMGYAVEFGGLWREYPAVPTRLVDTIGAGDTFTAGLLDGLAGRGLLESAALAAAEPADIEQVLLRAATAAAITCSRTGADPPTRDELDAMLAAMPATGDAPAI